MKGGSSSHVIVSCTSMGVLYNFQVDCIQIFKFSGRGGGGNRARLEGGGIPGPLTKKQYCH